ncbi:hypothetical protein P8452_54885 [Trifolium repens]|nr:hypothetical protein P8452_54885 [Trifolium repens]
MIISRFLFLVATNDVGDFVATLWEDDFDYELPKCKGTFDCATDVCPSGTKPYCMYGRCFCLSAWSPEKFIPT